MASFDGRLVSITAPSSGDVQGPIMPIIDGGLVPTSAVAGSDAGFFIPLQPQAPYVPPTSVQPLLKTWQFDVNQIIPSALDNTTYRKDLLFKIKESLIGFDQSPWQVAGSSDSITAGMDGVDRWLSPADIIHAPNGQPHSWVVLEQPGLGGMQLLLGLAWTDPAVGRVRVSQTGA